MALPAHLLATLATGGSHHSRIVSGVTDCFEHVSVEETAPATGNTTIMLLCCASQDVTVGAPSFLLDDHIDATRLFDDVRNNLVGGNMCLFEMLMARRRGGKSFVFAP